MWRLAIALILAICLCPISPSLASAQDFNPKDYFQLNYDPVTFSKNEIKGSEVFHATIAGRATCTQDLPVPLPVSEVIITSKVVAEHIESGATVTLNPGYTVTIKPFPSKKGDNIEISQSVPLQFPAEAESGDYNIIGKINEAHIKLVLGSLEITSYLPPEQSMGTVKYTAPVSTEAPTPPSPEPEQSPQPTLKSTPAGPAAPAPAEAETGMPWWAELIVLIAVATTIFNIIWFLRHRAT